MMITDTDNDQLNYCTIVAKPYESCISTNFMAKAMGAKLHGGSIP